MFEYLSTAFIQGGHLLNISCVNYYDVYLGCHCYIEVIRYNEKNFENRYTKIPLKKLWWEKLKISIISHKHEERLTLCFDNDQSNWSIFHDKHLFSNAEVGKSKHYLSMISIFDFYWEGDNLSQTPVYASQRNKHQHRRSLQMQIKPLHDMETVQGTPPSYT